MATTELTIRILSAVIALAALIAVVFIDSKRVDTKKGGVDVKLLLAAVSCAVHIPTSCRILNSQS
jgi:uncharacterized membrane protein YqjE